MMILFYSEPITKWSNFNELSPDQIFAMYSEVEEIRDKHLKHSRKLSKLQMLTTTVS